MRKYYYAEGKVQRGPFTFDELKEYNITTNTKVWCEGMSNWERAGDVEDLSRLFNSIPPPIPEDTPPPIPDDTLSLTPEDIPLTTSFLSKKRLVFTIGGLLIFLVVGAIWGIPKWQGGKLYTKGLNEYKKTGQIDSTLFFGAAEKGNKSANYFVGKFYFDKKDTIRARDFFNKTKDYNRDYGYWLKCANTSEYGCRGINTWSSG